MAQGTMPHRSRAAPLMLSSSLWSPQLAEKDTYVAHVRNMACCGINSIQYARSTLASINARRVMLVDKVEARASVRVIM